MGSLNEPRILPDAANGPFDWSIRHNITSLRVLVFPPPCSPNKKNQKIPCLIFSTALISPSTLTAGWSSPAARQAHNLKVAGSNPAPATNV